MFTAIFFKKTWVWIKHYWYWPVIIVLLVFSVVSGTTSRKKLFSLLTKQKENYEKEVQIIKEAAEEKDNKKTEIFTNHIKSLKDLETEHNIKLAELQEEKREELITIVKENRDNPEELAEKVAKVLSAELYKKNR
tara:strand:- start:142 stop:546 length:405 start_codon:yes stop_codon:yes gene_type:complete